MDDRSTGRKLLALSSLLGRIDRLNSASGEIGAGMLATLKSEAAEVQPLAAQLPDLVADGLLIRRLLNISVDQIKLATFADILDGIEDAHDYVSPTTFVGARAHLQNAIEQTERIHPS